MKNLTRPLRERPFCGRFLPSPWWKKKRIWVIFGGRFWLTQLQSGHVWRVILKRISYVYQAIRKLNPNNPWNFIFALYLTSLMIREIGSRKFQNCLRDMKFFFTRLIFVELKKLPLSVIFFQCRHFFGDSSDHLENFEKF